MESGKSLDGYTVEFYRIVLGDIGSLVKNSVEYAYDSNSFSESQTQGVITCLPLPGKCKMQLKNWKPISLLNVDYKIASACIAARVKKHSTYLK